MFYLMIIAVPISVGSILLAEPLIAKVYGPVFGASVPALQILMAGLPFIFLNFPIGYLLNATNRQTKNTINIGITLVVSIILNLILIQQYNFIGASVTNLVSTVLLFSLGLWQVGRVIQYQKWILLKVLLKAVVAAVGMAAIILIWKATGSLLKTTEFLSVIMISFLTYCGILLLLGGMNRQDFTKIYQAIAKKVVS